MPSLNSGSPPHRRPDPIRSRAHHASARTSETPSLRDHSNQMELSRLGRLSGWLRCSRFVTRILGNDPRLRCLPVDGPSGESARLASACWPDRSSVRVAARDPSQFCRPRFPPQDRRPAVSPNAWAGGRRSDACRLGLDYIEADLHLAIRTRSRWSRSAPARLLEATVAATATATRTWSASCWWNSNAAGWRAPGRRHRPPFFGRGLTRSTPAASGCSRSAGCAGSGARAAKPTHRTRSAPSAACSRASGRRRAGGDARALQALNSRTRGRRRRRADLSARDLLITTPACGASCGR